MTDLYIFQLTAVGLSDLPSFFGSNQSLAYGNVVACSDSNLRWASETYPRHSSLRLECDLKTA